MAELKFITLAEIKQQCRIESDFTLEDDRLTSYGLSAESTLAHDMGRGKSVTAMIVVYRGIRRGARRHQERRADAGECVVQASCAG